MFQEDLKSQSVFLLFLTIFIYLGVYLNLINLGEFYKPRKARFIPTFCKRINRTSTAVGRWVKAFEERRRTTFSVTKFIYNKQQTGFYTKYNKQRICKSSKKSSMF